MNEDQVMGRAKFIAGKVQQQAGKLAGNKQQQVKGLAKQITGKMQESFGDVRQSAENPDKG